MTDIVPVTSTLVPIPQNTPEQTIKQAAHVATLLKDIIQQQKLFTRMGAKDYPHVDAWIALGSLMNAIPREKHIEETKDHDFIATVEIIDKYTKEVLMEASSMCGSDEPTWKSRPRFARRSMAVTRATGKSFRLLYSWVMCMAGYAPTPEEEMPNSTAEKRIPDAPKRDLVGEAKYAIYTGTTDQQRGIETILKKQKVPEEKWGAVNERMMNKPYSQTAIRSVIEGLEA